ncbi:helix-turn-helix transcriptional regulator [Clostridium celatum]|nr:helix-turn-helix transcriptional regulator [Clostridium celatum]
MEVKTYGDNIRKKRLLLGMTQREYARFKNISYNTLLKLEYGLLKY